MKHLFLLTAVLLGGIAGHPSSAQAQNYRWCSQYDNPSGAHSCAFSTRGQCRQTVSGIGGYCYRNPGYGRRRY